MFNDPYRTFAWLEIALAAVTLLALVFVTAPYGRHARKGWGPGVGERLGWMLMESPAALWFAWNCLRAPHGREPVALALFALWELHYLYRVAVFPLLMRTGGHPMPLAIAGLAFAFNLLNGYVNGQAVAGAGAQGPEWLRDPRLYAGAALFVAGFALHVLSDRTLRRLRAPGERGYKIPRGGAYRLVSSPNYLGEILEWSGWALATWSLGGLAFALYTFANLAPRAFSNHAWYRRTFPDYPPERRALVPFLL
jgi:protein-S-isoprenylcysteine O-methyltransferase Ste14